MHTRSEIAAARVQVAIRGDEAPEWVRALADLPLTESEEPKPGGVWAVVLRDYREGIERVFDTEIEALSWVNENGYGWVRFIPWGTSLVEMDDEH